MKAWRKDNQRIAARRKRLEAANDFESLAKMPTMWTKKQVQQTKQSEHKAPSLILKLLLVKVGILSMPQAFPELMTE